MAIKEIAFEKTETATKKQRQKETDWYEERLQQTAIRDSSNQRAKQRENESARESSSTETETMDNGQRQQETPRDSKQRQQQTETGGSTRHEPEEAETETKGDSSQRYKNAAASRCRQAYRKKENIQTSISAQR